MNIWVTGSAGMIGRYVVNGLIEKGHTVICICYALVGKEATWILNELKADAEESSRG